MTDIRETSTERPSAADKPYDRPAIVHELKLETRAGSPLIKDLSVDPVGIDPTKSQ